MNSPTQRQAPVAISRGLTLLFAFAGGAAVGNLYWAQPLLAAIAKEMNVTAGQAGLLVTATQVGYAAGVLLLVPLGDTLNRRRVIPVLMTCSVAALLASALAPSFTVLLVSLAAVGVTTVTGQLLIPLAGDLAPQEQRGRVVGTVVSGVLTGILLSRTISGLVADAFGWRAVYFLAATGTLVFAILLGRALPTLSPRAALPYTRLLSSVLTAVRGHRTVQVNLVVCSCAFAVFTMFWTGLTFHLSAPPFSYSLAEIGLVGLVGVAGALAARRAGWLHDRGWSLPATGAALLLALVSLAIAAMGAKFIILVLGAVVLIDVAIQVLNVLTRTSLFDIDPNARSRLNTVFVTSNFVGGAVGSTMAGLLWQRGEWLAVTSGGGVLIGVALVAWLTQWKRSRARTALGPSI